MRSLEVVFQLCFSFMGEFLVYVGTVIHVKTLIAEETVVQALAGFTTVVLLFREA